MNLFNILFVLTIWAAVSTNAGETNYKQDLEEASTFLRSTLKDTLDSGSDFKTQLFKYVTDSGRGKKYFLHALLMAHQILNEPQPKEILEFLKDNGVDIMKLFSINVPSTLYESLQEDSKEGVDEKKDKEELDKKLSSLPFQEIHDFLDIPKLITVWLQLIERNAAVRYVWEYLSRPQLHIEVGGIISKAEYKEFLEAMGSIFVEASDIPKGAVVYGLMKMFNVHGDRKAVRYGDRFMEGLRVIGDCLEFPDSLVCQTVEKLRTKKKTEL